MNELLTKMPGENTHFWKDVVRGKKIPGSTRVPIVEIRSHLLLNNLPLDGLGVTIVDAGSGAGRSTIELVQNFPLASIDAFDLSLDGVRNTDTSTRLKFQGSVDALPYPDSSIDVFVLCGLMTNLATPDPGSSIALRKKTVREIYRCLKPGGLCTISDFDQSQTLSEYPVNYERHALITNEHGTIAVFSREAKVTFKDKSDDDIRMLKHSTNLERYAHHYSQKEITTLLRDGGFFVDSLTVILGSTPSGTPIDNMVVNAIKI